MSHLPKGHLPAPTVPEPSLRMEPPHVSRRLQHPPVHTFRSLTASMLGDKKERPRPVERPVFSFAFCDPINLRIRDVAIAPFTSVSNRRILTAGISTLRAGIFRVNLIPAVSFRGKWVICLGGRSKRLHPQIRCPRFTVRPIA